jgi:hypothetical protein
MRITLESSNIQAIRCWLMAGVEWPAECEDDQERLRQFLQSESKRIKALPLEELSRRAEQKAQRDGKGGERLLTWSWRYDSIPLSDFGPWRTVGDGLPLEACRRSAVEAADFIRNHPHSLPHPTNLEQQTRYQEHLARIRKQARFSDVLRSLPFLAVLVAEQDHRGRESCNSLRYSSEDGSHRAIAMALAGHSTVAAWIGRALLK